MPPTNPFLALDRLIMGDIYTAREAMENLEVLCDDFGARFAGTPEEKQAADFIAETFTRYRLQNVHLEDYPYAGWSRGEATLEIVEPIQKTLRCISLPYCPAAQVEADLVNVGCGTPDDYEKAGDSLQGAIVMASSRSPHGLGRWIHRKEKYERAVLGGASVFLFISEVPGAGPETGSLQNGRPAPIPGISVALEDGEFLTRLAERRGKVRLRLHTTDVNEPRTSWNVIADLPGEVDPDSMVVLGCHYDGHDISQGAVDPASGMVAVMEAARVLSAHAAGVLRRTVRFIAYGTEEIGLIGSRRYVEMHPDEMSRICFVLNMDAAGGGSRKGVVLHHWPQLEEFFRRAGREMAAELPLGQKVHAYSDHFPFFLAGVPTGEIGDAEKAPSGRGFGHTHWDTLDKVQLVNLRDASAVAARLALRIAQADEWPAARRDGQAVEEIVATDPDLEGYRVGLELAGRLS